jgi:hypothetical protein
MVVCRLRASGKVLAGFVITFMLGTLVLLLGYVLGWTQPQGIYWLSALLTIVLVSLFSAGLGVAVGACASRSGRYCPGYLLNATGHYKLTGLKI